MRAGALELELIFGDGFGRVREKVEEVEEVEEVKVEVEVE